MRIFIGLLLEDEVKEKIYDAQEFVLSSVSKGRRTSKENFHLTLKFIGNVAEESVTDFIEVLDTAFIGMDPFDADFGNASYFTKSKGKIVWLDVLSGKDKIVQLEAKLTESLVSNGLIEAVDETYVPHLTIARQVRGYINQTSSRIHTKIDNVTLFESVNVDGTLKYIPIYSYKL